MKILVVGGSGYLGQFVVEDLASSHEVSFTHHSSKAPSTFPKNVQAYWADLKTGEGFGNMFEKMGPVDVVVNCAAISSPAVCERFPVAARQVNVPTALLDGLDDLKKRGEVEPFLIHLSTDQVYDGSKAMWVEDDKCQPINTYGKTKLEAEEIIQQRWPHHVILRSSIIYGPQCSSPVSRTLFLQMIVGVLEDKKPTTFINDEFRSPIYLQDILKIIRATIDKRKELPATVLNMGGPERLSRVDMANAVADTYDLDKEGTILSVPSAAVARPVASPADISMNSARLAILGISFTPLKAALEEMKPHLLTAA